MNGYSIYYRMLGNQFQLPSNNSINIGTGQGWHSTGRYRGAMSMVAHIAIRLLLGQARAPNTGNVLLDVFQVQPMGMEIIRLCNNFANDGDFVSYFNVKLVFLC